MAEKEKRENIAWILSELPGLVTRGVIPAEAGETLKSHYEGRLAALPSPQRIFSLVPALIGCVMAAAGIILLLNYNWDMFPKGVRMGISALPLVLGAGIGIFTIAKEKGQLWREASAVFTSAGAAVLIAMLSQIYHTVGELNEFMFLVLLLSLPQIYLFNSIGLATLYVFFSFFVPGLIGGTPSPHWWSGLLCVLFLPYLGFHLRNGTPYAVWCRYLALFTALCAFRGCGSYYSFLPAAILSGLFFVAGADFMSSGVRFWKNPWLIPSYACLVLLLAFGSGNDFCFRIDLETGKEALWSYWVLTACAALAYLGVFLRRRLTAERSLTLLLILVTVVPLLVKEPVMRVLYNVLFGLFGVVLMRNGVVRRSLPVFNGGAVMLCVLCACRFFDSGIGVIYRAGGFILLGLIFIGANVLFTRIGGREVAK